MKKNPLFIVIEGIDGSGKNTQSQLLKQYYEEKGQKVLLLDYPRYESDSSTCLTKYLKGKYGPVNSVSIFQASIMYTLDRLDHYLLELRNSWAEYDIVISNRYTTSNLLHQSAKLLESTDTSQVEDKLQEFKQWLYNLEYTVCGLYQPDIVIYLQLPVEQSLKNISSRGQVKDEHETLSHLSNALKAGIYWGQKEGWSLINCYDSENDCLYSKQYVLEKIQTQIEQQKK